MAAGLAFAIAANPAASQESGTITGIVTDEATGQLLEGTRVAYEGGTRWALATEAGRYVLANVPAGTHTLTFELIGYESATAEVQVTGGATTEHDITLLSGAIALQALVATGVARATPKVKLPIAVERLDAELLPVPAISAESILTAKLPGVKVVKGSGQPGSTGDILLRGATSISGGQSALIVIDGVISGTALDDLAGLDIASVELVKGAAGASLYGSRAANGVIVIRTKRGSGFAGQDYSRILVRNEVGGDEMPGRVQLSQYHPWKMRDDQLRDPDDEPIDSFPLGSQRPDLEHEDGASKSFQDNEWPSTLTLYDHIARIYTTGVYTSNYVATEGRDGDTNYRASIERNDQNGVLSKWNDGFQRRGFRLNLDHAVRDYLKLSVSSAYNHLDQEDYTTTLGGSTVSYGPFFDLTFMGPYIDLLRRDSSTMNVSPCPKEGCLFVNPDPLSNQENPLYAFELVDFRDKQENVRASANFLWSPLSWADLEGNFGFDKNAFREKNVVPEGLESAGDAPPSLGDLRKAQSHTTRVNSDLTLSMSRAFGDIATRMRLRYLQEIENYEDVVVEGSDFTAQDIWEFPNVNPETITGSSQTTEVLAEGFYMISALDYMGKYIADGVVRIDGSSLFGKKQRWQTYWRAAAAWRPTQEPWWPLASVNELKLRTALGTAGRRPSFWHQYESYRVSGGVITAQTLGNANLKPQRSTELEAGVDLVLFNKVTAGANYARTISRDQIVTIPLARHTGFTRQVRNAGVMSNNTVELFVEAPIVGTRDLGWDFRLNWDRTRQRIDSLYLPPFRSGFFYFKAGEKFGAFYGHTWATSCDDLPRFSDDASVQSAICDSYFDINDDGLLVYTGGADYTQGIQGGNFLWGETSADDTTFVVTYETGEETIVYDWGLPIKVFGQNPSVDVDEDTARICNYKVQSEPGCGPSLYMGNTTPSFNVSLMNTFRWKGLELYALLDGEFGAMIYNRTRQWAYRENRSADQDQAGKDDQYKKPVAYYQRLYDANALNSWFVEEGDFVKLRELALTYSTSPELLDMLFGGRVSGMELSVIGRNLLTFTDYSGYDPEVGLSNNGGSAAVGRIDDYQYPNYRTMSASLRLVF